MFNLADYETVEVRLEKFIKDYADFRISTELEVVEKDRYIVKAYLYKSSTDSVAWATGYAEEKITDRGVNATSALENCETSAIGRALANAGYASKGKRPSREEMSKVVASKPVKPPVAEVKADDQDYWTTPVGQYNKVVDNKAWGGYFCSVVNHQGGEPKCPTVWYSLSSSGKFEPQKAWA